MTDLVSLYGTDQPPVTGEQITLGDVSLTLQGAVLRHIHVGGVEIIRSIAFLVRDRDWGTIDPVLGDIRHDVQNGLRLCIPMSFRNGDACLDVKVTVQVREKTISVQADGMATGDFETNRAGFTVLHPIKGVAGAPAIVTHADGTQENSRFPLLIEPWQPFMDIAAIECRTADLAVRCSFSGDVFEMEDQRQWGDASYKTYNRPLALTWPYQIADAEVLEQSVEVTWRRTEMVVPAAWGALPDLPRFPEMALVLTADDAQQLDTTIAAIDKIGPQRLLCHVDAGKGAVKQQLAAFAALQSALRTLTYDLELIGRFDGTQPPESELTCHAEAAAAVGFQPASVFVCPSVDRQSTPPGSDWPVCPPLQDIHAAVARAFPDLPRGGGMASFFPELNRKRPPVQRLDFVTHGLCPIVHAADDVSVMETLEAIPHIARSARVIAQGCEYRIGPATIAMRQNPYGSRTIPNPQGGRVCMTDDDPRHRGAFGAAYVMGLATALAPFDASVWTPAAVLGPRGVNGDWPLIDALRVLAKLAGQPVGKAQISDGIAILELGTNRLCANLTGGPLAGLAAYGWAIEEL